MNKRMKQIVDSCYRIDLDITAQCNRTCSFCPRVDDIIYPNMKKEMSLDTVAEVLKQCVKYGYNGWIELAGRGEPTLHKHFEMIVSMIADHPQKTWKLRLTTNGFSIEKWWDSVSPKLDWLILNSYDSEEEYKERCEKYEKLPNDQYVQNEYKPDGTSIEEINKISYEDKANPLPDGFQWKHSFNNRAGFFSNQSQALLCTHPHTQIFINYDGDYQMCCNDWLNQVTIGNIHERRLFDMYANDEKLKFIRKALQNARRDLIAPCSKCDDSTDMSVMKRLKKDHGDNWFDELKNMSILVSEAEEGKYITRTIIE